MVKAIWRAMEAFIARLDHKLFLRASCNNHDTAVCALVDLHATLA
jgi:hypothetical protein